MNEFYSKTILLSNPYALIKYYKQLILYPYFYY